MTHTGGLPMRMLTLLSNALIASACLVVIGLAYSPKRRRDAPIEDVAPDGRCQATTRRGTRCRHRARPGETTCSQHR